MTEVGPPGKDATIIVGSPSSKLGGGNQSPLMQPAAAPSGVRTWHGDPHDSCEFDCLPPANVARCSFVPTGTKILLKLYQRISTLTCKCFGCGCANT